MKKLILISILLSGCTDATWSKVTSLGKHHEIHCYSGGKLIYEGASTGVVHNEENSDGFYFQEVSSGKIIRVNADCVVETQ